MGAILSYFDWFSEKKYSILLIGHENSGKQTIVQAIRCHELGFDIPNIGFSHEDSEYKKLSIHPFHFSITEKVKSILNHYLIECRGIIYIFDCSEEKYINQARKDLEYIIEKSRPNSPILLFANKQDLLTILQEEDVIINQFHLSEIKDRLWKVQGTCAITREGIFEGLDWLNSII